MNIFAKKTKGWQELLDHAKETDIANINERTKANLSFLGIDQRTLIHVQEAAEWLHPHKEEIVEVFYKNISAVAHLNHIILEHSTIARLKGTMTRYLEQFLKANVDYEYVKSRVIIGKVHSRIHLTADHFISSHHLLLQAMTSILMEKLHNKQKRMTNYVLAVQKLGAFDQQLIVEVYMEDTFKQFLFGISDMINHTTQLDTTRQLITGMEQQMEETHNVTAATEQMSASIQEVANHAVKVSEGTDDAVQSALESKKIVDEALHDIREVGHVYSDVVEKVNQLEKEIEHTKNVIKIITDIADQTNLLALNASIEAARAGEQGKGFVVVASEVRKLSENTKEQITQITNNMNSLQEVSEQVTEEINHTGTLVKQSVAGAEYAGNALTEIVTTMKGINDATSQIAAMSEEQTSAVVDIAERNAVIYDQSVATQNIAKHTAETVLNLSKQMEKYRNTFFTINMKLSSEDITRVAKTDHLLWKWKVYNMILGIEKIDLDQVTSHKQCRLGKWYYSELPPYVKELDVFKQIEVPHQAVHDYAKAAVERYERGDLDGAQAAFGELEQASKTVIALLTELEDQIS